MVVDNVIEDGTEVEVTYELRRVCVFVDGVGFDGGMPYRERRILLNTNPKNAFIPRYSI